MTVEPDSRSRVIVNERTGTIVMGKQVHVSPVAIMHGNLSVEVQTNFLVFAAEWLLAGHDPGGAGAKGDGPAGEIPQRRLQDGATVEDLVRGLNAIGSTPRDIIAILQALRAAGALEAEVEVI